MALVVRVEVVEELPMPPPGTVDALATVVRAALTAESRDGRWEIVVALVSDHALRRLHRDFMGLDSETDIMTFPRGSGKQGGDVAISVDRAMDQAGEHGLSPWEEVRFLVVHGVLHLCGWDDGSDAERAAMLARQTAILASMDAAQAAGSSVR